MNTLQLLYSSNMEVGLRNNCWFEVWPSSQEKMIHGLHLTSTFWNLQLVSCTSTTTRESGRHSLKLSSLWNTERHPGTCRNGYKGGPKTPQNLFVKNCVYSYMFKLQSPSMYSPFDAIHLLRWFFYCSKQFLNLSILMPFSASALFCFTSSTSTKHFPLRAFFMGGGARK